MTRKQVAQRLGKSLATVRRIEGVLLHPVQDSRGVHRFDGNEVETLARDIESGRAPLTRQLRPTGNQLPMTNSQPQDCANCLEFQKDVDKLRDELDELRSKHRRELEALQAEHNRERAKQDAEASELATQVAELLATLDD